MFSSIKNLVVGVIIGILIAPDKGSKTRQKVVDIFSDFKDNAKDVITDTAERIKSEVTSESAV